LDLGQLLRKRSPDCENLRGELLLHLSFSLRAASNGHCVRIRESGNLRLVRLELIRASTRVEVALTRVEVLFCSFSHAIRISVITAADETIFAPPPRSLERPANLRVGTLCIGGRALVTLLNRSLLLGEGAVQRRALFARLNQRLSCSRSCLKFSVPRFHAGQHFTGCGGPVVGSGGGSSPRVDASCELRLKQGVD
jgi:hypothetical protein